MTDLENRRAVLGTLVALPFGLFLVNCGGSNSYGLASGDAPAAAPSKSGGTIVYSSNDVQSHFHTFSLQVTDLDRPPAEGVSGGTSSAQGHTHTVGISMSDLQSVNVGQTVKVTTSTTSGHEHVFTFVRVS